MSKRDYSLLCTAYCQSVMDGSQPAGKCVRQAVKRHLDDLARVADPDYLYTFDQAKADKVCRFLELLPHVKGQFASRHEKFTMSPWQVFVTSCMFGWVRKDTGYRRFRNIYVCVSRKNGKSFWSAAIGLYMFAADGEVGAEVYAASNSEKQSFHVFEPARLMVSRTPALQQALGIEVNARSLVRHGDGSKFLPIIGRPADGASVHCAILDEFHEADSAELYDCLKTGMASRLQGMLIVITTAGSTINGPCHTYQQHVEKILEGTLIQDDLFGIIYTVDENDDWTSVDALKKANPNWGVSVVPENLIADQLAAVQFSQKQNIFRTKHLCVWCGANTAFINMAKWNALGDSKLHPDQFIGCQFFAGCDLASKTDLASVVLVAKKDIDGKPHYYCFGRHYIPEERTKDPAKQNYQAWARQGYLITTPGNAIDQEFMCKQTIADVQKYRVLEFGYDMYNADMFSQKVAAETQATVIVVPQTAIHQSGPMKELDALILDSRFHHDNNPAMNWMASNLVAHRDSNDNLKPNKPNPDAKNDGMVALISALARASLSTGGTSEYFNYQGF